MTDPLAPRSLTSAEGDATAVHAPQAGALDGNQRSGAWLDAACVPGLATVVMPACNAAAHITESLQSILQQTYRPIEVMVVDDGSTDDTAAVARRFAATQDARFSVRCLTQERMGASHARNRAAALSRGEYIQFLDADDLLAPSKIRHQVDVLESGAGRNVDVVYGDAKYLVSLQGRPNQEGRTLTMGPVEDVLAAMLTGQWNPVFSYLSRRSAVRRCGPWDASLRVNQDYDYFLRMAIHGGRFLYHPLFTGFYRKHSMSSLSEQALRVRAEARERILQRVERLLLEAEPLSPARARALAEGYRRLGRWIIAHDNAGFERCLRKIDTLCPGYRPAGRIPGLLTRSLGLGTAERLLERFAWLKPGRPSGWV